MKPLVVALTGTDHHPFDRLVDWVDKAALRRRDVRFVVQYGASRPPSVADCHAYLTHDDLVTMLREAAVVVCHGGPGTIMDAREAGHVPLCVPRNPDLGEHVDGHQQRFAAAVASTGVVRAISSMDTFQHALDDALDGPPLVADAAAHLVRDASRAEVAAELNRIVLMRSRRMSLHRATQ